MAAREAEPCADRNACTTGDLCDRGECLGTSPCGVPLSAGGVPHVSDGLYILRAAVGIGACTICECDTNGDMRFTVADALVATRIAVGLEGTLDCFLPDDVAASSAVPTTLTTMTSSTTLPAATALDNVSSRH